MALGLGGAAGAQGTDPRLAPTSEADAHYERGARALRQGDIAAAVENLEKAARAAPDDPTIQSAYARALLAADRADEAAAILERLEQRGEARGEDELALGIALYETGEYAGARERLTRAVQQDPGNAAAQLYLGSTLLELEAYAEAEPHLGEAQRLDPSLTAQVEYRRGRIALARGDRDEAEARFQEVERLAPGSPIARAARQQLRYGAAVERPWSLYATFGGAYDSNVNLAGGDNQLSSSREDDWRAFAEVGADYDVFENDRFSLRAGASSYISYHEDERDFDLLSGRVWTVGAVKLSERVTLDTRYTYEFLWANFRQFRRTHVGEPSLRIRPAQDWLTRVFLRYEDRDFFTTPVTNAFDRDGQLLIPGVEQYLFLPDFTGWGSGFVRVGYRWRSEDTDGTEFDSSGHQANLMLGMPLPYDLYGLVSGSYEWRHHESRSVLEPQDRRRRDRIRRLRVILRRPLSEHLTAEIGYRWTKWGSSVDFYDYTRHIGQFLVTYQY